MKFKQAFLSFILCGLLSFCSKTQKSHEELVFCTNSTYPPYESINDEGKPIGFDIDVAHEIARKLNKKLIYKEFAFDSLILGLDQNKCDFIMAGMSITPSRQKEITMIPYQGEPSKSYYLLFWKEIPKDIQSIQDIQKLSNKTLAVQIGTWMEEYTQKTPGITVKALESTPELLLELQYHKSAAAFIEPHIAKEVLSQNKNLKSLEVSLPKDEWRLGNGIGIKKSNSQLSNQIQNIIDSMKKNGELKVLEKKWFH